MNAADQRIARAAGVVMLGFLIANLTGLARQMLVLGTFGTGAEIDSYFAAARLPTLLFSLLAGGALASAFVPTFTGLLTDGDRPGAWRLASSVTNLILLGLTAFAAAVFVAAPWLVRHLIAPGFTDPVQIDLTVELLRILLLSPILFGASGLLMGILNAHQHFLLPALAPAMSNLGVIAGVLFFVPRLGIYGLAWGAVFGAALHLVIQLPGLSRRQARYHPVLGLRNPSVRQVFRLMAPRLLSVGIVEINFLVNAIIASGLPTGSLTALTNAFTIMLMPQALIAQSTAIAALPTFSAQAAAGAFGELRASLARTLRGLLFLALPATLGLMLLRTPIVAMLFERGAFTPESTELVAWALLWYAVGLPGHALLEVVVRAFFSLKDTLRPTLVSLGAMGLNIILSLTLTSVFAGVGWKPVGGLALANSLATGVEALVLILLIRRRLDGLAWSAIQRGVFAALGSSAAMTIGILAWLRASEGLADVWVGLGGVALGGALYYAVARLLRAPEAEQLPQMILPRRRIP
ncbi:MAG TPA: murein biosynthesis integral membrane protein MurJ [Anaerolineales bacterium]|nr:murein biosynthesis integral membrane protein MurJ [Anaerolineales bacterium]